MGELHSKILLLRNGVNMRHVGRVRTALADLQEEAPDREELSALLLREMIARVCKNVLRQKMRERILKLTYSRDEPFKGIIASFLNLIGTSDLRYHPCLNTMEI